MRREQKTLMATEKGHHLLRVLPGPFLLGRLQQVVSVLDRSISGLGYAVLKHHDPNRKPDDPQGDEEG